MRRLIIVLLLISAAQFVNGQTAGHAIGLRLGGGNGFGTEISYQQGLTNKNRLEFDLGIHSSNDHNAWGLTGLYQWVWKIDGGFNWFAGVGGRIGSWNWENGSRHTDNGMFLSAAGNIGIEYAFPVGIQLGLDYRPELGIITKGNSFDNNLALSIRYQF